MSFISVSFGRKAETKKSTGTRKGSKKASPTTLAIALAMAAKKSPLPDTAMVPYVEVTVGDLRHKINIRPNGTVGAHYPACFGHEAEATKAATSWLVAQGQLAVMPPKAAETVAETQPAELAALRAELAALKAALGEAPSEPVKPSVEFDGVIYEVTVGTNGRLYGTPKA